MSCRFLSKPQRFVKFWISNFSQIWRLSHNLLYYGNLVKNLGNQINDTANLYFWTMLYFAFLDEVYLGRVICLFQWNFCPDLKISMKTNINSKHFLDWIFSILSGICCTLIYCKAYAFILSKFNYCFTLGEAGVVSQAAVILLFGTILNLLNSGDNMHLFKSNVQISTIIIQVILLYFFIDFSTIIVLVRSLWSCCYCSTCP